MSTTGKLCEKCGNRIATISKGGTVKPLPGNIVTRMYAMYALTKCGACGHEQQVRYPRDKAA